MAHKLKSFWIKKLLIVHCKISAQEFYLTVYLFMYRINYTVMKGSPYMEYFENMANAEDELYKKWKVMKQQWFFFSSSMINNNNKALLSKYQSGFLRLCMNFSYRKLPWTAPLIRRDTAYGTILLESNTHTFWRWM